MSDAAEQDPPGPRTPSIGPRHNSGGGPGERAGQGVARSAPGVTRAGNALLSLATEVVVVLGLALALSLLIKTFLVQAFFIPSQSMENTLLIGDRVMVSKLTPGPFALHRGDVVVFKDPGNWLPPPVEPEDSGLPRLVRETLTFVGLLPQDMGEHLIKRVIGMPGDTVACCDAQGRMTVNDVPIDEPYLFPGDSPSTIEFSVTVPAGSLWLMGDHRSVSKDSRYNEVQFVPEDHVVGKAFVVVWPFDRFGGITGAGRAFAAVPDRSPP